MQQALMNVKKMSTTDSVKLLLKRIRQDMQRGHFIYYKLANIRLLYIQICLGLYVCA